VRGERLAVTCENSHGDGREESLITRYSRLQRESGAESKLRADRVGVGNRFELWRSVYQYVSALNPV
jgi:hypothetical protein